MTETAFLLRGVGYRIGAATILDDVTLDIPYGRLLALVGPNGAGKSTLLGVLTGDVAPSVGEVTLDGVPLSQWSARDLSRARAVLLQSNHVAFSFTAADVVEMGRAPWLGATRGRRAGAAGARPAGSVDGASVAPDGGVDADERAIAEAMALADVSHLADRAYPSLSGGEKARVSLARVLAQETRVVMLDEPTAALDLRHQEDADDREHSRGGKGARGRGGAARPVPRGGVRRRHRDHRCRSSSPSARPPRSSPRSASARSMGRRCGCCPTPTQDARWCCPVDFRRWWLPGALRLG